MGDVRYTVLNNHTGVESSHTFSTKFQRKQNPEHNLLQLQY